MGFSKELFTQLREEEARTEHESNLANNEKFSESGYCRNERSKGNGKKFPSRKR